MMHLYQKREAILRSTRQEISRNGISAFRVEEVARLLGMSKRTIYRIFPTRADLLRDCILLMGAEVKGRIHALEKKDGNEPVKGIWQLLEEYVDGLYQVEGIFLRELKQSPEYTGKWREVRETWKMALVKFMEQGKQQGDLLAHTDFSLIADRLLTALFESRVEEEFPYARQLVFCRTLLRGIATPAGIARIEEEVELTGIEKEK